MTRLHASKIFFVIIVFTSMAAISSLGQSFTTLAKFDGKDGGFPSSTPLLQGIDGWFHGATDGGGVGIRQNGGDGVIFKFAPEQGISRVHVFCSKTNCPDGASPKGLMQAIDGSFYGTTLSGGTYGFGTIFRLDPTGLLTLHNFDGYEGSFPNAGLVQGPDGIYGITSFGGPNGYGTVFKSTPGGGIKTLYAFSGVDGGVPASVLVPGIDGKMFGSTFSGGAYGDWGTIFTMTTSGRLTMLHSFCFEQSGQGYCADGAYPNGLLQASDGNFYGTTQIGGTADCYHTDGGCGTVFRITSSGAFTTLYNFCSERSGQNCDDGSTPRAGLIQATDGNFYGTTANGGTYDKGTLFQITPIGTLTVLHSFCGQANCIDGDTPWTGLLQATDGRFYGTTAYGGDVTCDYCGTIYSLDLQLAPFVVFMRNLGKVGLVDGILGQGFTGATGVSFNGTPAVFSVRSDTFLTTKVPVGATTGLVTVTTSIGTLTSNKPFRVTPQLLSFDPPSGPVGTQVTVTGVSLTQTKGVGFGNRVPAQFTVNSDTQVTSTVPAGAKTGKIGIETNGGIAISSGTFTVTP